MSNKKLIGNGLSIILMLIVFLNLSSAVFDWSEYGNSIETRMAHTQPINTLGHFESGQNVSSTSISQGYSSSYATTSYNEPLVSSFNTSSEFIIFQNGNYLQFYDSFLNLINEEYIGMQVYYPLAIGNFDDTTDVLNQVAGIWKINATDLQFNIYRFNTTNSQINYLISTNLTFGGTSDGSTGVRCISGFNSADSYCNSVVWYLNGTTYYNYFVKFYGNGSTISYFLNSSNKQPFEALSWIDANNDGITEYLMTSQDKAIVFNDNGVIIREISNATNGNIDHARFVKSDGSVQYRVLTTHRNQVIGGVCSGSYNCVKVAVWKLDGSQLWSNQYGATSSGDYKQESNPAILNYNGDLVDDIFLTISQVGSNNRTDYYILKASDGSTSYSLQAPITLSDTSGGATSIGVHTTLAYMEGSQYVIYPDFISFGKNKMSVFSPNTNRSLFNISTSSNFHQFIPADINYDGFQEIVGLGQSQLFVISSNATNSNPIIYSLIFSPSTTINTNSQLSITINATDREGDVILYSSDCGDGISVPESFNSVQTCTYQTAGIYNYTAYARDGFHQTFSSYGYTINVFTGGLSCNVNYVCESGETYANCPSDCSALTNGTQQVSGSAGGSMNIPSTLVDTTDETQGLLPEIYKGTLVFLSNTLQPIIVLVFAIFIVLIILAIGGIIKNIAHKVTSR